MQHHFPILIVGQGIAGTLLSFELWQKGIPFTVIDRMDKSCASIVSGAVLNPYSGKTLKGLSRRNLMYDIAKEKYEHIGQIINQQIVKPSPLLLFENKRENTNYVDSDTILKHFKRPNVVEYFEAVALVDNVKLIEAWQQWLSSHNLLLESNFDEKKMVLKADGVEYEDVFYSKIIFCNGVDAMQSDYFKALRFTTNRGDVLLLKIPDLPEQFVYQKDKVRLLPKGDGIFWCGSNYGWTYDSMLPNEVWKNETMAQLQDWLQCPFELLAHICAKRPTTAGQIPFVGWHPRLQHIGICNGLGTKGFSAGPMWIADFVEQSIVQNKASLYQNVLNKWL